MCTAVFRVEADSSYLSTPATMGKCPQMEVTKTRDERKAELEQLSATDQGRFELVELLNSYRGQDAGKKPTGRYAPGDRNSRPRVRSA